MTKTKIEQLLNLIDELMSEDGSWREKRDALLSEASDEQKLNINEFAAWFEEA